MPPYHLLFRDNPDTGSREYSIIHATRSIPEGWSRADWKDYPTYRAARDAQDELRAAEPVGYLPLPDDGVVASGDRFQVARTAVVSRSALIDWHRDVARRARSLMETKNMDYAGEEDAFGNLRLCEDAGAASIARGILIRMLDKIKRMVNLTEPGRSAAVEDEKLLDNVLDIINYSVLFSASLGLHEDGHPHRE